MILYSNMYMCIYIYDYIYVYVLQCCYFAILTSSDINDHVFCEKMI